MHYYEALPCSFGEMSSETQLGSGLDRLSQSHSSLVLSCLHSLWRPCDFSEFLPRGQAFASNHTISQDFVFLLWHSIQPLPWRNESQLAPFVEWSASLVLLLSQCLPLDLTVEGYSTLFVHLFFCFTGLSSLGGLEPWLPAPDLEQCLL